MTAALLLLFLAAPPEHCGTLERLAQVRAGQRFDRPPVGQCHIDAYYAWVHYDTSGRHRTTHAYAESTGAYTARAWFRQVIEHGWAEPPPDGGGPDGRLDIYLEDTNAWSGLTSPEDQYDDPYEDGWTTFIEFDVGMTWPDLENTVAHEFNHTSQFRYSGVEIAGFYENTAAWMADWTMEGWGYGAWWLNGYRHPLDSTHFRLSRFSYPGWLWPRFLHEYYADPDCPRKVWEQLGAESGENTYWGTWVTLFTHYSSSLERALGHYAIWRWFTGSRDDSRHFEDAEDWQTSRCHHWYNQYPAIDSATDRLPESPGGCKYVGFTGFGANRVRIFFDGEDGRSWKVYGLGLGSTPREYLIDLPNSADTGSIVIPGWQYDTIILVPVAASFVESGGLRFGWRVTLEADSTGMVECSKTDIEPALSCRITPDGAVFRYSLPAGRPGRLSVFDACGRFVDGVNVTGTGHGTDLLWPGPKSRAVPAAYFCRLDAGGASRTAKVVLTKE